jgi:hypothetical protein
MTPPANFPDRVCLVTGASTGLGRDFAEIFAREGYHCILVARREDALRGVADAIRQKFSAQVDVIASDLTAPDACAKIVAAVEALGVAPSVLVNNAGSGSFGEFLALPADEHRQAIDLNIRALTELTHAFARGMVSRRRGRILNVASTAAFQPGPLMAVYYASKAYVLSFSEALANELEGTGVTVTALCPGPTATEFHARANISISKLKKSGWMMPSRAVAEVGYRATMRGRRVAIPGWINWFIAESVRLTPRFLVLKVARWVQEQGREPAR